LYVNEKFKTKCVSLLAVTQKYKYDAVQHVFLTKSLPVTISTTKQDILKCNKQQLHGN